MMAVTSETVGHNDEDRREELRRGRGGGRRLDDYYLAQ